MSGGLGDDTQIGGAGTDTIYAQPGRRRVVRRFRQRPALGARQCRRAAAGRRHAARRGRQRHVLHTRRGARPHRLRERHEGQRAARPVDVIVDATAANPKGSCETVKRAAPKAKEDASENSRESPDGRPRRGLTRQAPRGPGVHRDTTGSCGSGDHPRLRSRHFARAARPPCEPFATRRSHSRAVYNAARRQIVNSVSSPLNARSSRRSSVNPERRATARDGSLAGAITAST